MCLLSLERGTEFSSSAVESSFAWPLLRDQSRYEHCTDAGRHHQPPLMQEDLPCDHETHHRSYVGNELGDAGPSKLE